VRLLGVSVHNFSAEADGLPADWLPFGDSSEA
jgi:hypothetical protein